MNARWGLPLVLVLVAGIAAAREKRSVKPLDSYDAVALQGKSLMITRRQPVDVEMHVFTPEQADATHNLLVAYLSISAEQDEQLRNPAHDPADLIERELVPAFVQAFSPEAIPGMVRLPAKATTEQTLAQQADADYVLDFRSRNIVVSLRKTFGKVYWVGYGVEVRLLARGMTKPVFYDYCYFDTVDHPASPEIESLTEEDGRLYRDTLDSLAWRCVQRVAADLKLPPESVPETPAELLDPLTAYATAHPPPPPEPVPASHTYRKKHGTQF